MPNVFNPLKFNMHGFLKEVKYFKDSFTVSSSNEKLPFDGVKFYHFVESETHYLKIGTEQNEIYGAMRLKQFPFRGNSYMIVERICTTEKYRGKGIMKLLYNHCVENLEFNLMSDSTHTTFGSKDFWIKMRDYYPNKKMYVLNLKTNYKKLFTTQEEHLIWGKEEDEDFDLLEIEDKAYLLEELYASKVLSNEQFVFFKNNIKYIQNRSHIRLSIEN